MNEFRVDSEVGKLRKVLVHRPGLELRRLTPSNHDELLFDDVLWVRRAVEQHDEFASIMRDRGVEVFYLGELLAQTLDEEVARRWVVERVVSDHTVGVGACAEVRLALMEMPAALPPPANTPPACRTSPTCTLHKGAAGRGQGADSR